MALTLVADFDSKEKATLAIENLVVAGIPRDHIDSYPSLAPTAVSEPSAGEGVKGAETRVSSEGPLGHLQALLAKLFDVGKPDSPVSGGSEPTLEEAENEYVFLAVEATGDPASADAVRSVLEKAGASRVGVHTL